MARVNITVPDELVEQARAAGLNVSRLASLALAEELDRLARIAELDGYLAELEAELGPIPPAELAAAQAWADELFVPVVPAPGILVDGSSAATRSTAARPARSIAAKARQ